MPRPVSRGSTARTTYSAPREEKTWCCSSVCSAVFNFFRCCGRCKAVEKPKKKLKNDGSLLYHIRVRKAFLEKEITRMKDTTDEYKEDIKTLSKLELLPEADQKAHEYVKKVIDPLIRENEEIEKKWKEEKEKRQVEKNLAFINDVLRRQGHTPLSLESNFESSTIGIRPLSLLRQRPVGHSTAEPSTEEVQAIEEAFFAEKYSGEGLLQKQGWTPAIGSEYILRKIRAGGFDIAKTVQKFSSDMQGDPDLKLLRRTYG